MWSIVGIDELSLHNLFRLLSVWLVNEVSFDGAREAGLSICDGPTNIALVRLE